MNKKRHISRLPYFVAKKSYEMGGRRFTQEEIADETGLTQATVSRWMSDKPLSLLDIDTAKALGKWAGCEWYELVEEVPAGESTEDTELMPEAAPAA